MTTSALKLRCRVYIDGYNFYYGLLKDRPDWKWLDIEKFFVSLLNRFYIVDKIKYFTAIVDEDHAYSPTRERQEKFLSALGTTPRVEIVFGEYQQKLLRCEADCRQEYFVPREKKTDVNIAVHMIADCLADTTEAVVLVSGDSDLQPAVAWLHRKYPEMPIIVYIPRLPKDVDIRRADFYKSVSVECLPLPTGRIPASQFSTAVKIGPAKFVQRPVEWALPLP